GAEVQSDDAAAAQRPQEAHGRAGAAADVQGRVEGAERGQVVGDRLEHVVGGAERGVVELGGQEVVAALGGGQRVHGEFPERRPLGVEHVTSLAATRSAAQGSAPGWDPTPTRSPALRSGSRLNYLRRCASKRSASSALIKPSPSVSIWRNCSSVP